MSSLYNKFKSMLNPTYGRYCHTDKDPRTRVTLSLHKVKQYIQTYKAVQEAYFDMSGHTELASTWRAIIDSAEGPCGTKTVYMYLKQSHQQLNNSQFNSANYRAVMLGGFGRDHGLQNAVCADAVYSSKSTCRLAFTHEWIPLGLILDCMVGKGAAGIKLPENTIILEDNVTVCEKTLTIRPLSYFKRRKKRKNKEKV